MSRLFAGFNSCIVQTPEVCVGRTRIVGTGVTVRRIVGWYKLGLSPEEIVQDIPHLTLAQVYVALAYYHANREEIEQDMAEEEAEAEQLEHLHQRSPDTTPMRIRLYLDEDSILAQGKSHAGIILARQQHYSVGEQMRRLLKLIATKSAEEMKNQVEFLSAWD